MCRLRTEGPYPMISQFRTLLLGVLNHHKGVIVSSTNKNALCHGNTGPLRGVVGFSQNTDKPVIAATWKAQRVQMNYDVGRHSDRYSN